MNNEDILKLRHHNKQDPNRKVRRNLFKIKFPLVTDYDFSDLLSNDLLICKDNCIDSINRA